MFWNMLLVLNNIEETYCCENFWDKHGIDITKKVAGIWLGYLNWHNVNHDYTRA